MSSEYTYNAPSFHADLIDISQDGFYDAKEDKENVHHVISNSEEESVQQRAGRKRKCCDYPGPSSASKYRSLAESIYHFPMDMRPRFRGVSIKSSGLPLSTVPVINPTSSRVTVSEEFHFISDQRLRHRSHNCLSHEERELQEIEEAKQHFKPQQLNKKIFEPPKEVDREKKFTIPKPFRFTYTPKKPVEGKKEVFVFKARPLPPNIYGNSLRRSTNREMKKIYHVFKARPAAVLTKKPFQVRKSDRGTTKFLDLKLNTEIRAQQRQVYEVHRKFIQAEREQMESKFNEEKKLKEQEEVAKLRKELVHKPLPVPKAVYNKTSPQSRNKHSE